MSRIHWLSVVVWRTWTAEHGKLHHPEYRKLLKYFRFCKARSCHLRRRWIVITFRVIAWTIRPTPSLFVAQRPSTYSHWNMGKFWETRGGGGAEKVARWSTKAAIYLKRVQMEKLLWNGGPIRTQQRSNGTNPTPYGPLHLDWGSQPPPKLQSKFAGKRMHIEEQSVWKAFRIFLEWGVLV